jgi:hypothetical protein
MKHQFQVQERRRAVGNMFDNILNMPDDGKPVILDDFLNNVVAQTPIDE